MVKGQVANPKDIRKFLGVASGDRMTFLVEENIVRIVDLRFKLCMYFKGKGLEKQSAQV